MEKKTGIIVIIIGVIILAMILLAVALDSKTGEMSSNEVLRINSEVYTRAEFEEYIKYLLYENDGEMVIDEENHHEDIEAGVAISEIFKSDALNDFSKMKLYGLVAEAKKVKITDDEMEVIDSEFEANKDKILAYGLTEKEYKSIAKQQSLMNRISDYPSDYIDLSDEIVEAYTSVYSGDDLKSYTYRIIEVGYDADKVSGEVSGESSGELIPGNKEEKQTYINTLIARINSGESFENVAKSGDNRIIFSGNDLQFGTGLEEYSAKFFLEQRMSKELYEATLKTNEGELTDVVDTGSSFQVALIEKIEDGIVGKSKEELVELLTSEYQVDLIYNEYVKNFEVNTSAVTRITIK